MSRHNRSHQRFSFIILILFLFALVALNTPMLDSVSALDNWSHSTYQDPPSKPTPPDKVRTSKDQKKEERPQPLICEDCDPCPSCGVNEPPIANPGGPYSGSPGQSILFNGSGSWDPDGWLTSYQWNFGDGATGTGVSPSHAFSSPGSYTVTLTVIDNNGAARSASTTANISSQEGKGSQSNIQTSAINNRFFTKVTDTDVAAFGMGGLRNVGHGSFFVSNITGTVTQAFLYWHGPTSITGSAAGRSVLVNNVRVFGTPIGASDDNNWTGYQISQAYRCDITSLVAPTPNKFYTLSSFADYPSFNPNGASLIIFYDDGNASNNRDVTLYDGNDSNQINNLDSNGWHVSITGINYTSGQGILQFHVADGQNYQDPSVSINSLPFLSGFFFQGFTVPSGDGNFFFENLWDIRAFDITQYLVPGNNNLTITSPDAAQLDALSLIVALVSVPAAPGQVQSVTLEQIDSAITANTNAGGGSRIFPDRQTPGDPVNRRRVRVKATTSMGANKTVFFKSFDVDDPSTDSAPVDTNGSSGNDNRGQPLAGVLSAVSAQTDANGVATVELSTTMHPGDNFVVAASKDQSYLNALTINGTGLRDSSGATLPTTKAKASSMLTVWRRVHIEVDSMGLVHNNYVKAKITAITPLSHNSHRISLNQPIEAGRYSDSSGVIQGVLLLLGGANYSILSSGANSVDIATPSGFPHPTDSTCWVLDDDDFNANDPTFRGDDNEDVQGLSENFALLQDSDDPTKNVYAPAYIRPVYDGGGDLANNQSNLFFDLNTPDTVINIDAQLTLGWDSELAESDEFWVVYVQFAYQGAADVDDDPNSESTLAGASLVFNATDDVTGAAGVPDGGYGSLLFLETQTDSDRRGTDARRRALPHEIGHQFGLMGDNLLFAEFGIMNPVGFQTFGPRHLNVLRWRISSPGD